MIYLLWIAIYWQSEKRW